MKRDTRRDASGEEHEVSAETRKAARAILRSEPEAMHYANMGTTAIVASCAKTYGDEVARLTLMGEFELSEIRRKAADLWRAVLPDLVDHRTTLAYIACIAWGTKMQLLTPQETKAMMFMAQTQLTVLRGIAEAEAARPPKDAEPGQVGSLFMEAERPAQSSMEPTAEQMRR